MGMGVYSQPVAMNGKLYMRGWSNENISVLVYTPDQDHWDDLTPPPLECLTMATLRGQLLVVGGRDRSTDKTMNTILTFDERSKQWLQSLPLMPLFLSYPAVVEYQDHLIIAGGHKFSCTDSTEVNILDTTTNKWITAEPLPNTDNYNPCLIGDTLYLVGWENKRVLRADVPSLISRASSGVWEIVSSLPWYHSFSVTVSNTLLTLGGRDNPFFASGNKTADIHLYDPTNDQWTKCGDLPKPINFYCIELFDKLYVFEPISSSSSVYVSTPSIVHD